MRSTFSFGAGHIPKIQFHRACTPGMRYDKAVKQMSSSESTTRNIRVRVQAQYDSSRSRPQQSLWFFLYTVRITNEGHDAVQLVSRHWVITDGMGKVEEVQGLKSTRYGRNLSIQTTIGP